MIGTWPIREESGFMVWFFFLLYSITASVSRTPRGKKQQNYKIIYSSLLLPTCSLFREYAVSGGIYNYTFGLDVSVIMLYNDVFHNVYVPDK